MDIIIEELLSLIIESSYEGTKSKKVPKVVRIILATFLILFFSLIIGVLLLAGILSLKNNLKMGIALILLGLFFLISFIVKILNTYKEIKNRKE